MKAGWDQRTEKLVLISFYIRSPEQKIVFILLFPLLHEKTS